MRAIICLVALPLFLFPADIQAASDLDAPTQRQLVQLEAKYFGHSFDADSYDDRTVRLEKLIFGEPTPGDLTQRIQKLVVATGAGSAEDTVSYQEHDHSSHTKRSNDIKPSFSTGRNNHKDESTPNLQTAFTMPSGTFSTNGSAPESYPHIATLENEILGRSFPSQPVTERLNKMEVKVFGSASDDPDLSERTDALDHYVEQKLHKSPFPASPKDEAIANLENNVQTSSQTNPQTNQSPAKYPHVTALENEILGRSFDGQLLPDRLSRMETKAFGKPSKSTDLSQRTDALEKYAEKKLHKQPYEQERNETASANSQPKQSRLPQQLLSMLGNSLLGMAGGFGGIGPGFGPGGLLPGGMPNNGSGIGISGTGIGTPHHGSSQSQQAQQSQPQQQQAIPKATEDDPAVHLATPPAANTKLLTKVGWCEVQVFGHTFPDMHLTERLSQLNQELQVKPGAPNMQLLDDVGLMIKAVQSRNFASK